jgi:predicted nucleic-acid-binding Zn-ribbon protein
MTLPSLVLLARFAVKSTLFIHLYLYRSNIRRKMELDTCLVSCSDIDPDGKGENYVDVEVENHRYRQLCCSHCGAEITVPIYCGNRFCPVCSRPRLSRVRRRLDFLIKNTSKESGYGLKFLTLTIPNQTDLQTMLQHLTRSFRRLRQRAEWKRRVLGGAFVLECSGSSSGWHAHLHAIVFAKYISFERLLRMWLRCSGGRGVYIKQIPPSVATGYLTKYLSKPAIADVDLQLAAEEIKRYRLFQPFGIWMALLKDFSETKPGCPNCGSHSFFPLDLIYNQTRSIVSAWNSS